MHEVNTKVNNLSDAWENFKETNKKTLTRIEEKTHDVTSNIDLKMSNMNKLIDECRTKIGYIEKSNNIHNINSIYHNKSKTPFSTFHSNEMNAKMKHFILGINNNISSNYNHYDDTAFKTEMNEYFLTRIWEKSTLRAIFSVNKITKGDLNYYVNDKPEMSAFWGSPDTITSSEFALSKKTIFVFSLHVNMKLAQDMVLDNFFDLEKWIDKEIISAFVFAEEKSFINGDGTQQPTGIFLAPDPNNIIQTNKQGELSSNDLMELYHSLGKKYITEDTRFLMNRSTMHKIRTLKYLDGHYIWEPSLYNSEPDKLFGIPVVFSDHIIDDITSTKPFIAFGDFKAAYVVADKDEFTIINDPYTSKPDIVLYATRKVGGNVVNSSAMKFLSYVPVTT